LEDTDKEEIQVGKVGELLTEVLGDKAIPGILGCNNIVITIRSTCRE
jgi:hypothetical protein